MAMMIACIGRQRLSWFHVRRLGRFRFRDRRWLGSRSNGTLEFVETPHAGVKVRTGSFRQEDGIEFKERLVYSIEEWKQQGKRAVWLPFDAGKQLGLCSTSMECGFAFHHAKGYDLMMYKWIHEELPDKVPPYGFHQIGVGALVFNSKDEMLLIKEKNGRINRWKMPGGLLDPGELISQAAQREVQEETGVKTEFHGVLGFWQRHGLAFGQGDIYVVCRLSAVDPEQPFKIDRAEVSDCCWMPIEEYVSEANAQGQHPMIKSVLRSCFTIQGPNDVSYSPRENGIIGPLVEMRPHSLEIYRNGPCFQTFLTSWNGRK